MIKKILHFLWGLPQNIIGLIVLFFTKLRGAKSEKYKDALVTRWRLGSGISLGMFIFVSKGAGEKTIKHEYGHTKQSMVLGPLYLAVVGLPSFIWAGCFKKYRAKHNRSYYSLYCEKWADKWGGVDRLYY